jgi:hypothetical protein
MKTYQGYIHVVQHGHPRATRDGYVPEQVLVVEKALGHYLPLTAIVHHVDDNKINNSPSNLVVCPDIAYHKLLHARMRAYKACGNPNWRLCCLCKKPDDPVNMTKGTTNYRHRACIVEDSRKRRLQRKQKHGSNATI